MTENQVRMVTHPSSVRTGYSPFFQAVKNYFFYSFFILLFIKYKLNLILLICCAKLTNQKFLTYIFKLLQQNLKTFLLKMMIVRENFGDFEFAADIHRNAVGQTVTFVEARFVEFERVEKR